MKLTLDTNLSKEKEEFIKNLITHKAKLDIIRGDTIDITKTSFSNSTFGDLFAKKSDSESESIFNEKNIMNLIMGLIALALLIGVIFIFVLIKRRLSHKTPTTISNGHTMASMPQSIESSITESNPNLEYTKQDLVSLSLSNRMLAEDMIKEVQLGAESNQTLASIYLTLGERLFCKLYPNIDVDGIKTFSNNNSLEKTDIAERFELFTASLAEKHEVGGDKYRPFHFLDNLDNAQVLFLLQDESTKIKALAISQLSPGRSAKIIQSISKDEQASVAFELSQFDKLPIESFKDIANKLAIKAQRVPSYSNIDIDGEQILLNLLDNMNQAGVNEFLSTLQSDSPDVYYKLRNIYFIFDDLVRIPVKILKTIVREFPRTDISLALQQTPEDLSTHVLSAFPARLAGAIREELELSKDKATQIQIDDARQNITNIVRHLIKHNRLSVSDLVKEEQQ